MTDHTFSPLARRTGRITALTAIALLGITGLSGSTNAIVSSGERAIFVPISPCRLMDTRSGSVNVGPRSAPLGAGETYSPMARGTNGFCTIPSSASAVAMNVTIVNPTNASFLTVFPPDAAKPLASSLNWVAGQAPTPNAVTSKLAANGTIGFFNNVGTVDVIADIVGYYDDHNFDDRYYTKAEVDARLAAQATQVVVSTGFSIPALVPTSNFSTVNESVVTTKAGHLLVTKSFIGTYDCSLSAPAFYYLMLDGVPLKSSVTVRPISGPSQYFDTFVGVTPDVVAAGTHVIAIGAQCPAGFTSPGSGTIGNSVASVTVLD